jgi:pimeloyl-ACP methyl ester carboxylesterase
VPESVRAVVFVADGAGDFRCTSAALRQAVDDAGLPLDVETFVWSHGYRRRLADQMDKRHAHAQGQRLAGLIAAHLQSCPGASIYLLGHSAGAAVVLAAAECLPPASVERVILLAPALPADYDLRLALRATRQGIDVFCSGRDSCLRVVECLELFKNGRCCTPAGSSGFRPLIHPAEEAALYGKLRQYPWNPGLECFGNDGGHSGCYQQEFLRAFVLPLLCEPTGW